MTNRIAHTTSNGTLPATPLDGIMEEQGRQNQWLARKVGVSHALVSFWRSGDRSLTKRHIAAVADALGVSVEDLA